MKGPFTRLPRPPRTTDTFEQSKWFDRIWMILSAIPGISWDVVDKAGSKLSDIETRPHSMLQSVYGSDATNSGIVIEDTIHVKHVSDEQAKRWENGSFVAFQTAAELLMITQAATSSVTSVPTVPSYDGLYLMGGM